MYNMHPGLKYCVGISQKIDPGFFDPGFLFKKRLTREKNTMKPTLRVTLFEQIHEI